MSTEVYDFDAIWDGLAKCSYCGYPEPCTCESTSDRCTACDAHISEPHDPACESSDGE
ncbi:Uncharacterised protein [Mycobacteroides abscessus subsp. massiliense]|nr:Uncharacterised protein [Mycobacteroides abscessus subsp. abscessus]SKN34047.1 Uncharacterised protein [Mycobacteroides abscessus subsp. massiliense]SKP57471.1 Uncharacterised protein [Mycobacteroides abscessus subsp. massiliense]SKU20217.1 Uncharacterised protein [Mycobacteroides abscessus subsp. massiliense]